MSEKMNKGLNFDSSQIYTESRELLGTKQLEPLSVFSTEEHLQRSLDALRTNPGTFSVTNSNIAGGNSLLNTHGRMLETQHPYIEAPDRIPRLSGLNSLFNLGFGMVERTVVSHPVGRTGSDTIGPEAYNTWAQQPLDERLKDIKAFLAAQEADLLAHALLDDDGSMMQVTKAFNVTFPRVTGGEPYVVHVNEDPAAPTQLTEGAMAAFYLLREHQIAQEMHGMDEFLSPVEPETPPKAPRPPETPPGHYLG